MGHFPFPLVVLMLHLACWEADSPSIQELGYVLLSSFKDHKANNTLCQQTDCRRFLEALIISCVTTSRAECFPVTANSAILSTYLSKVNGMKPLHS